LVNQIPFEVFEEQVMKKLLNGDHENLAVLRMQYEKVKSVDREFSGAGFFSNFNLSDEAPKLNLEKLQFGDVIGKINNMTDDVGFVLFINNGTIDFLEGYIYGEDKWPEEILEYKLQYISGKERKVNFFSKNS
jgi:hypothetical protein